MNQLEVFPIKGKQVRSNAAGAQSQKDVVQHLLDFRFSAGLSAGRPGNESPGLFPILKRWGDHPPGPFEGPDIRLHQTFGLSIKSAGVKLFYNDARNMGLEDQRQESTLKERRAPVGAHGEKIDVRVQKNRQLTYL